MPPDFDSVIFGRSGNHGVFALPIFVLAKSHRTNRKAADCALMSYETATAPCIFLEL